MNIKTPAITPSAVLAIAGLCVGAFVIFKIKSAGIKSVATGIVNGVNDAAAGTVGGVCEVIGIPQTGVSECEQAMRDGRSWDASFACPLPVYAKYMLGDTQGAIDKLHSSGAMTN